MNLLYYRFKPFLPRGLRIALRRGVMRRKLPGCSGLWPIDEAAGRPPADWAGWPDGKKFGFVITHDVEGPAGVDRSLPLAEMDAAAGFRSSFNFIPEGEYRVAPELRQALARRGFEVGVHDLRHDGHLYRSRGDFADHARRINEYLKEWGSRGFRSGFMLHNLEWLADLDVAYDSSTFDTDPFEPQPDGVGTIFPFWVPRADGTEYLELPYTLPQDSTLFIYLQETSIAIWQRKLDWLVERGGLALVNVHPDYMAFAGAAPHPFQFPAVWYQQFLQYVNDRYGGQFWHGTARELAEVLAARRRARPPTAPHP